MSKNTDIVEILQSVEDRIVAKLYTDADPHVLDDPSQVIWAEDEMPLQIKGNFDIILHPQRDMAIQSVVESGGRAAARISQTIDVLVRVSSATGMTGNDKDRITKRVRIEKQVLNYLWLFFPKDSDGEELMTCQMIWLGGSSARKRSAPPAKNLWSDTSLSFEVHYRGLIDPLNVNP